MPEKHSTDSGEWTRDTGGGLEYRICGEFAQILEIRLRGHQVFAQAGCMIWMSGTSMTVSGGGGGLARAVGGGGYFLAKFDGDHPAAKIGLAPKEPGTIVPYSLDGGMAILCERKSFLAAGGGIEVGGVLQKNVRAGVFGGEGIALQRISGIGTAFLACGGRATEHELSEGEVLVVDPGHVAFFEESIRYDVGTTSGVKNFLFGGEGLFLAKLSGPGKVWTQAHWASENTAR